MTKAIGIPYNNTVWIDDRKFLLHIFFFFFHLTCILGQQIISKMEQKGKLNVHMARSQCPVCTPNPQYSFSKWAKRVFHPGRGKPYIIFEPNETSFPTTALCFCANILICIDVRQGQLQTKEDLSYLSPYNQKTMKSKQVTVNLNRSGLDFETLCDVFFFFFF